MQGWRLVSVLVVGLGLSAPARALPMLTIELSRLKIGVGETATATVKGMEIPAGTDLAGLFGFGFAIAFQASGLAASTPSIDSQWTGNSDVFVSAGSAGATANRVGQSSGPSGSGIVLATVVFTGLAKDNYLLELGPFTGPGDNVLFDGTCLDATDAYCSVENGDFFGSVTLEVPEPRWAALLLAAYWLLGLRRSRSRRG